MMNLCFVKPKRTLSYTASALVLAASFLAHDSANAMWNGEDDPKPPVIGQKRLGTEGKGKERVEIRRVTSTPFHEEETLDQGPSKETKRALIRDGKRRADDSIDDERAERKKARQAEESSLNQTETCPHTPAELYQMVEENPESVRSNPALQDHIVNALYDGKLILSPKQFESIFTEIDTRAYVDAKWAITLVTYCKTLPDDFMDIIKSQAENIIDFHVVIGKMYQYGRGVEKSDKEAVKWFLRAAKQGHSDAQNNLGRIYYAGRGVEKSYLDALKWFRKATDKGYAGAQLYLGLMYKNGQGVEQSDEEALKWFRKAADKGNADAQFCLGRMYYAGRGVRKSYLDALKWIRKAADKGNAGAQRYLGLMYKNGHGVEQSAEEALKWFRKAADKGNTDAQFCLGYMYYYAGRGVERSYLNALKWFRKAADKGYANAQFHLGHMYKNGQGVKRSDENAVKWFLKATENGCLETGFMLQTYFARTYARGGEYSPFHLTKNDRRKIQTFVGVLQCLAGLFSSHEGFAEGRSIPFLYDYLNQAANDLIQYEDLVSYLNKPGFLVTGIRPTFDIYTAVKEPRSVFPVYIGHDLYLCVGEENVKAGVQLQKLLLRMQNPHGFEASLAILELIADSDDEGTRESIRQLTNAKDFFIELEGKMSEHIVNYANGRARLFDERVLRPNTTEEYSFGNYLARDFFPRAKFADHFLRADMGAQY